MKSPEPVLTAHLFPELRQHLLSLLNGLSEQDWQRPTSADKWNVKDVALHLLGGDIGNLSRRRDQHSLPGPATSEWKDLVVYINSLNESWVVAGQRISPRVLCDLLAHVGPQMDAYFQSLDPFALGGSVDWMGTEPAPQWLDVAREYTERWHHQQQIRDATGKPGLYEPRLFAPVLDTFVRALPYTFRDLGAAEGTFVQLTITGPGGGDWAARKSAARWELLTGKAPGAAAEVTFRSEDAWKIFTKGIRGPEALQRADLRGDHRLGSRVVEMVSVIA
jgi:uncharacterized protein (TIGR03083 family)